MNWISLSLIVFALALLTLLESAWRSDAVRPGSRCLLEARYLCRMFLIQLLYFGRMLGLQLRYQIIKARHLGFCLSNLRLKFRLLRLQIANYVERLFIILALAKALKKFSDCLEDGGGRGGVEHILAFLHSISERFIITRPIGTPTPYDFI
jgi:hypothetical protein